MIGRPPSATLFPYTTLSGSLSINDVSQAEGNSGTTAFTFTVTLTGATAVPVSVDFATASGTAIGRSEEHTSAPQSPCHLVCRLLLANTARTTGSTPAKAVTL